MKRNNGIETVFAYPSEDGGFQQNNDKVTTAYNGIALLSLESVATAGNYNARMHDDVSR